LRHVLSAAFYRINALAAAVQQQHKLGVPIKSFISPRFEKHVQSLMRTFSKLENKILKKDIGHRAEFDDVMSEFGSLNTWFYQYHHPIIFRGSWLP
jgi:hypothetical protein